MLTLSPLQMARFEDSAALAFVARLVERLAAKFPDTFRGQPRFVRRQMVAQGLSTADGFGLTLESTLGGFVALQCATAPDFHTHPQVRLILTAAAPERLRFDRLIETVPQLLWNSIKSGADVRAWFDPVRPDQQAARIAIRVCDVFPELVDRIAETDLLQLFQQVTARARRHGIEANAGVVVYAAALAFYGTRLDEAGGPAWARELFSPPLLTPARTVALLRLRVSLDTDRII